MLHLRSLLSQLHAVSGQLQANVELVRAMFARAGSEAAISHDQPVTSRSPPAALTNAFVNHQRSVHDRLSSYAALYAAPDTRRVRLDTTELDELYDVDREACASNLFDLRAHSTGRQPAGTRKTELSLADGERKEERDADDKDVSVSPARRLLLSAVAKKVTDAELRLLYSLLRPPQRLMWRSVAEHIDGESEEKSAA